MGRKSTITRLDPRLRQAIERLLTDGRHTLDEILQALTEMADPGDRVPSRSAIARYKVAIDRKLAAVKASTEAARLIAESAPDDADLRSAAVMSMIQTETFDVMVQLQEAASEDDPGERLKLLSHAGKAIAELSRASVNQKRWQTQVRERIKTAAAAVDKVAGGAGLSAEALARIRQEIYGIAP